jgi:phosphohistidine phosphatase SixA
VDLYLVRHAIAEPRDLERWPDDSRRPLSSEGVELFRLAARGLGQLGIGVDGVLTSSYLRAAQTALVLTEEAEWPEAGTCPELEPPAAVADSVRMLELRAERLCARRPSAALAELASLLLCGRNTP